jgi:Sigma-70, region 4
VSEKLAARQRETLDAMNRLPEAEKLLVAAYLFEDLTLAEAAEEIGIGHSDARRLWKMASSRLAEELGMYEPDDPLALDQWAGPEAKAHYERAYRSFDDDLERRYREYFARHPELKDPAHDFSAAGFGQALAPGWRQLRGRLPGPPHLHYRSGKSSQMLALGLLGAAEERDDSLSWLWRSLELAGAGEGRPTTAFEYQLPSAVLNEGRRPTNVDYFVETDGTVMCLEAKWAEQGLGQCSCTKRDGNPFVGRCSPERAARQLYWDAASEIFSLAHERTTDRPCPISFAYQGVRNAAAALALAGPERRAVFALVFNDENPVFAGGEETGAWPGWAKLLRATVANAHPAYNFVFRALSWQALIKDLPLDSATAEWASEKHGLLA